MTENKSLNRLEAFSDGVFAIAITLLILDITFPHGGVESSLWDRLLALWPFLVAFVLSFFVILVTWITHHDLIRLVRESSRPLQLANGFALLYVTFIPFVTGVLAENLTNSSEVSTNDLLEDCNSKLIDGRLIMNYAAIIISTEK